VRRCLNRAALVIGLALAASAAAAQELDIFELSDFMDPRLRGAAFDKSGFAAIEHGSDFKIVRAVAGGVKNYDWRTRPSGRDVSFLHIVASHYSGLMQGNVKVTALGTPGDATLPRYRLTTQIARYMLSSVLDPNSKAAERYAGRFLATTSAEQTRSCHQNVCASHTDYEIGAQIDTSIPLRHGRSASGSLIAAFRNTAEEGRLFRATFVSRLADRSFKRVRVGAAFDVSAERASSLWKMGAVRLGMSYAYDIAAGVALNVAWTPSFVLPEPRRRLHNEVAFFVDRKLYSKIIPHAVSSAK